jgi:hypothetical protein
VAESRLSHQNHPPLAIGIANHNRADFHTSLIKTSTVFNEYLGVPCLLCGDSTVPDTVVVSLCHLAQTHTKVARIFARSCCADCADSRAKDFGFCEQLCALHNFYPQSICLNYIFADHAFDSRNLQGVAAR